MTITDTVVPYEILVRFNEDGAYQGAHFQRRRIVMDGDAKLADKLLDAEPLAEAGDLLSCIGDALPAIEAECERLRAEAEAMKERCDAADDARNLAEARAQTAEDRLAAIRASLAD